VFGSCVSTSSQKYAEKGKICQELSLLSSKKLNHCIKKDNSDNLKQREFGVSKATMGTHEVPKGLLFYRTPINIEEKTVVPMGQCV
jgi:hypothetical protein